MNKIISLRSYEIENIFTSEMESRINTFLDEEGVIELDGGYKERLFFIKKRLNFRKWSLDDGLNLPVNKKKKNTLKRV